VLIAVEAQLLAEDMDAGVELAHRAGPLGPSQGLVAQLDPKVLEGLHEAQA